VPAPGVSASRNFLFSYSQEDLDAFLGQPSAVDHAELVSAALCVRFLIPRIGAASATLGYLASTVGADCKYEDPLRYTTHLTNALIAIAIGRTIRSVQLHLALLSKHNLIRMFHRPQETGGYRPGIDLSPLAMMAPDISKAMAAAQATWQLSATQGNMPFHTADLAKYVSVDLLRKSLLLRGLAPTYVEAVIRGQILLGYN
jgi:hypothetical protein